MGLGEDGELTSPSEELFASARDARRRAQETVKRSQDIRLRVTAAWQLHQQAWVGMDRLLHARLSGRPDRLRYSATARLQAQLASMPAIEQAKGILMAQYGWTSEEAFNMLRQVSQQSQVRVRDLAARVVASTARKPDPMAG